MTEPMFDHERLDVYQRSGEHEHEKSHESSVGRAISRHLANTVDRLCLNPVTPYHSQGDLP